MTGVLYLVNLSDPSQYRKQHKTATLTSRLGIRGKGGCRIGSVGLLRQQYERYGDRDQLHVGVGVLVAPKLIFSTSKQAEKLGRSRRGVVSSLTRKQNYRATLSNTSVEMQAGDSGKAAPRFHSARLRRLRRGILMGTNNRITTRDVPLIVNSAPAPKR